MADNPMPRITPYLLYEDAGAALDWLADAFGCRERNRMAGPDGKVTHAEVEFADSLFMLGCPGPDYKNPKHLGASTQSLYIYVDDVDAIFARATGAGAEVLEEPNDQPYGDRRCGVADPEGHRWYFAQKIAAAE